MLGRYSQLKDLTNDSLHYCLLRSSYIRCDIRLIVDYTYYPLILQILVMDIVHRGHWRDGILRVSALNVCY